MNTSENESQSGHLSRALELIQAVANRDADPEDIVSQLRNEGFDALDVLVASFAGEARQSPAAHRRYARPIDVQSFSKPTPPERAAEIVHQVPKVPFVMNGTLYDPEDVNRFDGQELHFVDVRGELVAFDDRDVIARAWELMYIVPWGETRDTGPADQPAQPTGGPEGPAPWPWWPDVDPDDIGAFFYEDSGWDGWGSELFLEVNRGYWNLTQVGMGLFGDWNDEISAFRCHSNPWVTNRVCVLHEHVNMSGSSFTSVGPTGGRECFAHKELNSVGFNDRASSLETW